VPDRLPLNDDETRNCFDALTPMAKSGTHINFLADESPARVQASYAPNRLVDMKRRYEPTRAFHDNQNIAP
jgi:Berberine and berberine like